jgi:positive regulator of sigma E activity
MTRHGIIFYLLGVFLSVVIFFLLPTLELSTAAVTTFIVTLVFVGIIYVINWRRKVTIDGKFRSACRIKKIKAH